MRFVFSVVLISGHLDASDTVVSSYLDGNW